MVNVKATYTSTAVIIRSPERERVDLTRIGVKKADELVVKGFPYLKPKPAAKPDKDNKDAKE